MEPLAEPSRFPAATFVANRGTGFMDKPKSTRGFASMDPEKQRAIARKGGESVPNEKRSFSQNPALAAAAGRKGGTHVDPAKRSFSQNHTLASEAGRKGGHASHRNMRKGEAAE
jgi:uncharacterized protein